MFQATIICDASYNEDLHLGGYAGAIFVEDDGDEYWIRYSGIAADSPNSNDAEMKSIAMGAQKLNMLVEKTGKGLSRLDIYTDSRTAMNQYDLFVGGRQHNEKYSVTLGLMDQYIAPLATPKQLSFKHVKAHVPDREATPIQRLHNQLDLGAKKARWIAQDHVFKPDLSQTKHYGIVLPASTPPNQAHDLRQLAYVYAKQGLIARVSISGRVDETLESTHPFFQGLSLAAKDMGVTVNSLCEQVRWSRDGGMKNGCEGVDRTLLRHFYHERDQYTHHTNFQKNTHMYGAEVARIMFGQQSDEVLNSHQLTGRKSSASAFVINVYDSNVREFPLNVSDWCDTLLPYTTIPVQKGLKAAMQHLMVPEQWRLEDPLDSIKAIVKQIVERDLGAVGPKRLYSNVIGALGDAGIQISKEGRAGLLDIAERGVKVEWALPRMLNHVIRSQSTREPSVDIESPEKQLLKGYVSTPSVVSSPSLLAMR